MRTVFRTSGFRYFSLEKIGKDQVEDYAGEKAFL
jgi:hypothetical protein